MGGKRRWARLASNIEWVDAYRPSGVAPLHKIYYRHPMDWDNVRVFLAVARVGQFVAAAKRLRIDHATVSRRIAALTLHLSTGASPILATCNQYSYFDVKAIKLEYLLSCRPSRSATSRLKRIEP